MVKVPWHHDTHKCGICFAPADWMSKWHRRNRGEKAKKVRMISSSVAAAATCIICAFLKVFPLRNLLCKGLSEDVIHCPTTCNTNHAQNARPSCHSVRTRALAKTCEEFSNKFIIQWPSFDSPKICLVWGPHSLWLFPYLCCPTMSRLVTNPKTKMQAQ